VVPVIKQKPQTTNQKPLNLNNPDTMATSTPTIHNTDFTKWVYGDLKRNEKGGSIRIKESSTSFSSPTFQFPRLRTPFGVEDPYVNPEAAGAATERVASDVTRRNMTLNLDDEEVSAWLNRFDEHNINWVTANSPSVFGRVIKRSTVEDVVYYRTLRPAKGEYSPTFKIKVNTSGAKQTKIWIVVPGTTNQIYEGNYLDVARGSEVIPTVEATHLWANSTQVGVTFIATMLVVYPPVAQNTVPEGFSPVPRPVAGAATAATAAASVTPAPAPAALPKEEATVDAMDFDDPRSMF